MKILILGNSGLGKSPFTRLLVKELPGIKIIGASAWIRSQLPQHASIEELTSLSKEQLKENPMVCVNYINAEHYGYDPAISIIEGIRNPFDFTHLFDSRVDIAIFLSRAGVPPKSSFEGNGLEAIKSYVDFLLKEDLLDKRRVFRAHFYKQNKNSTSHTLHNYSDQELKEVSWFEDLEDAVTPIAKSILTL